jgi:hypothetical protein
MGLERRMEFKFVDLLPRAARNCLLIMTKTNCLVILEATSLKLRCWQGHAS